MFQNKIKIILFKISKLKAIKGNNYYKYYISQKFKQFSYFENIFTKILKLIY